MTGVRELNWHPIGEAPRDGSLVLVYGSGRYAVASWDGEEWRDMSDIGWAGMYGDEGNQPTHWIPLPEGPGEQRRTSAELEALRKCCVQRGARLQILRGLFRETDWHDACDDRPEMRDWFDERGVPK